MHERISGTYLIETAHPLAHAAAVLAGEQSTGTFVRVPGETDELTAAHAARVEAVEDLGPVERPSLPHAHPPRGVVNPIYRRARVVVSWPIENLGPSLPNLYATLMGNLFELQEFSGLRLVDVDLPPSFARAYQGPQFGMAGTRKLTGVERRPIIGTIVKPSVGLRPEQTASLVQTLCDAGLDFVKDDELMANGPHSPLTDRVAAVMRVVNAHADKTGKKVMVAFNITDEIDAMKRHHDAIVAAGGTCVMVSLNSLGPAAVAHLRRHSALPIHGHRNGWGMYTRCPALGIDFIAYQKLWRVAGVDHLHTNGLRNKFWEPDDSVIRSARAVMTPLFTSGPAWTVAPVLASAQWAGQAVESHRALGSADVLYVCGGGILAHPSGAVAGVASVQQAWDAALSGASLEDHARTHRELREALEHFGSRR